MIPNALLALDTSTEYCSVALLHWPRSGRSPRIASRHEHTGPASSTRVLPAVREVLDEAGLALADCAAVAFGAGPGSFTGLRTATGVAQGLAFGANVPVVPVSTLMACAERVRERHSDVQRVLAVLDARMGQVYWADFAWDAAAGDWVVRHPATLAAPGDVAIPDGSFVLAGNAAAVFGERLLACVRAESIEGDAMPHARQIAQIGWRALLSGRTVPAEQAAPDYVRDKVAQTTAERAAARAAKEVG
jgi:tRNA threonylcarbamoyladenosine biosynthesis protein TsaB